jgi:hypothetical protein
LRQNKTLSQTLVEELHLTLELFALLRKFTSFLFIFIGY